MLALGFCFLMSNWRHGTIRELHEPDYNGIFEDKSLRFIFKTRSMSALVCYRHLTAQSME
jgi:hypothetical protein